MSNLLRIEKYNKNWVTEFIRLKNHLSTILKDIDLEILHVGSTSVAGMYAKPILDIDIVYNKDFKLIKTELENNSYQFQGNLGIKDRYAFKYLDNDFYEHHLYVVKENCEALLNHLDLKRALTNSRKNRVRYSELKRKLITQNNVDRELYTESKTTLINEIILEDKL